MGWSEVLWSGVRYCGVERGICGVERGICGVEREWCPIEIE